MLSHTQFQQESCLVLHLFENEKIHHLQKTKAE